MDKKLDISGIKTEYAAYLLRIWSETSMKEDIIWRYSLEEVGSGHRYGFADLDALFTFLQARYGENNRQFND